MSERSLLPKIARLARLFGRPLRRQPAPRRAARWAGALAVVLALASPAPARAELIDRILVVMESGIITQTDVVRLLPIYTEVYGVEPTAFASRRACRTLVDEFMEFLIEARLLQASSVARQLAVSTAEVDEYVEEQHARLGMTAEAFTRELAASGVEIADFREFIALNLARVRMIQLDVSSRVAVSDEQVTRALAERYPDGLEDIFIETSHLFVQVTGEGATAAAAAMAAIEARAARLAAGEAFETVAAENDDGTRRTGGRIGRFAITSLDPEYARAALRLEPGEVSEPVRSSFGFHIVRLESLERAPVADASQIRGRVQFELHQAEAQQQQELYLERVRTEAYVDVRVEDFGYCDFIPE